MSIKELQKKQADSLRRLKEQQVNATANKPSLKSVSVLSNEQMETLSSKLNKNSGSSNAIVTGKASSKGQSSLDESRGKQQNAVNVEQERSNAAAAGNKQLSKSKSSPSVPTQSQKSNESERKVHLVRVLGYDLV